jgi:ATP-dependent DNA helicase RecG
LSLPQINWHSPVRSLIGKRKSKTIDKLESAGINSLGDLLWVFPLRTTVLPPIASFKTIAEHNHFKGIGKVLNFRHQPNFRGTGKGRAPLSNVTIVFQDRFSPGTITCKWFNCYPSAVTSLKELDFAFFSGSISTYLGSAQIISPEYIQITQEEFNLDLETWISKDGDNQEIKVTYPTFNGISPTHLLGVFEKIPQDLWDTIPEQVPQEILEKRNLISLTDSFKRIHGKAVKEELTDQALDEARARLIYEEFFLEQIKIVTRKSLLKARKAITLRQDAQWKPFAKLFSYELTPGQVSALDDINENLKAGTPMMRLIQGDVGSGKTTVSLIASALIAQEGYQASIMCPTESLALQHFLTAKELFNESLKVECLVGSIKKKEKDKILEKLKSGEIDLIIGTHALIQDGVIFKKLGLVTIDEQHKFGVAQRLKLVNKGEGAHCMLMTATPIPRSLSLTQYGDLEISTIKSMPSNRKGTKTRIVGPDTYSKYLSFLKTRVEMKEQAYVVVPAIEESAAQDMLNLELVLKKYKEYFPHFSIEGLHGKMKPEEKNEAFLNFRDQIIDILISTSVIEVGINNPNASVMAILNPERFGLSSLHQMRGRVGRGDKPGFCFLVNDKSISMTSQQRLQVIEANSDGFVIAEEDLKIRGEGDIFGKEQSGEKSTKYLASIIEHQESLNSAMEDVQIIKNQMPQLFKEIEENLAGDDFLLKTI